MKNEEFFLFIAHLFMSCTVFLNGFFLCLKGEFAGFIVLLSSIFLFSLSILYAKTFENFQDYDRLTALTITCENFENSFLSNTREIIKNAFKKMSS